jgi:hypothetical protein
MEKTESRKRKAGISSHTVVRSEASTHIMAHLVLMMMILMLVSNHSAAQSADLAREFLDGNRKTFSTDGHPKAKGVNFTIAYPSSWAAAEGERPNIVQKFVSNGGRGLESAVIITKELPLPPGTVLTKQDLRSLFTLSELRGWVPDGAVFVGAQSTEIEGVPAGILEYVARGERAGVGLQIHTWALNFISGKILVQIQFGVSGSAESEHDVSRRMAALKPLFVLIANSIVLPNEWASASEMQSRNTIPSSSSSLLAYDDNQLLILTLFGSLIVTCSVGTTPPLLIRYALVRHPLSKKAASWLAAGFSAFFWIAFFSLNHSLDQKPGIGVVWVIMFFVARWIMSRGHVALPTIAGEKSVDCLGRSS